MKYMTAILLVVVAYISGYYYFSIRAPIFIPSSPNRNNYAIRVSNPLLYWVFYPVGVIEIMIREGGDEKWSFRHG